MKIDATYADAEMRYLVDVDIIHDGCRKVTDYIIKVCEAFGLCKLHITLEIVRQVYLRFISQSKKRGKIVRGTMVVMLKFLHKNIRILFTLFAKDYKYYDSLFFYEKRTMTTIIKMYHQQKEMLRLKLYTCEDRILSIFQPHVRAIVHGKAKNDFGDKIGVSIVEGYTFINHRSWDAYNENQDLVLQIQLFKERFGCLLATLLADKIYLNKIN